MLRRMICGVVVALSLSARAQSPADALAENFYTPEFIKQVHELIGITEQQKTSVGAEIRDIQESIQVIREALAKESAALQDMAKSDKVDEEKLVAQADKVMGLESDVKRAQLRMLIKIKNALTPEQQAKLKELKTKMAGLQPKMKQVQEIAKVLQSKGVDLSEFASKKGDFEGLIQQGKFDEAEALLTATMKQLEEKLPK